jgi:hypothetical protein
MTRREMLALMGGALGAWAVGGTVLRAEADSDRLILSAPLTHSDWMLRPGIVWGDEGVRHMLDACKATGWSHIYWRILDGGRSLYKSKLVTPGEHVAYDSFYNPVSPQDRELVRKFSPDVTPQRMREITEKTAALDYSLFDSLAAAVNYGHQIGLKVHAWVSINEDDHGWGIRSDFSLKHPEYRWRRRNGEYYRSQLSFAFPEVREYKLGIIKELVANYPIDGLFVDWLRTGDVRDDPQTDFQGVADHGYEEPLVKSFQAKYGRDPHDLANGEDRWVRFRAEPHADFMRSVRKVARGLPVSVLVAHPWCYRGLHDKIDGSLRGLLLDVNAWAREGLIDAAVAAGYYMSGGTPEMAFDALRKETAGKADLWLYAWVPATVSDFERDFALAKKLGAARILFWEADYIDGRANKEELQRAMSSRAVLP